MHSSPVLVLSALIFVLFFHLADQKETAGCGWLPRGPEGGLHRAGHRLQWGEPHVDEAERSHRNEAQQWHPAAPPDLQQWQLLWSKHPESREQEKLEGF